MNAGFVLQKSSIDILFWRLLKEKLPIEFSRVMDSTASKDILERNC